jgi:Tol biopolymer transport system component
MTLGRRHLRVSPLLVVLLLALIAALAAFYVGALRSLPPPYGPADNGEVVYAHDGDLYVRAALGAEPRRLIGGPGDQASPFFSPDGRLLAFTTILGDRELLMAANADGSGPRQLLPDPLEDPYVVWGPDSRTLAVVTTIDSFPNLLLVRVDTGAVTRVLGPLDDVVPIDVTWRPPNGSELLIRARPGDGTLDLYTLHADGTGLQRLHLPSRLLFGMSWELTGSTYAPDGHQIAYNSVEHDPSADYDHFRVRVVNADGTGDTAMPPPPDPRVHEAWPIYSPDGRSILVHRWTWSWEGNEGWLAIMPADGSAPARDIGPHFPGGEKTGLIKAWSPDGSRVLVRNDDTQKVYSIDPVRNLVQQLDWTSELPEWQRTRR